MVDLTDGLITYLKFDETSGTTASDSVGSNDATVYGATWTTGKINNGLSFDGSNDYVSVGTTNILSTTQGSISLWFYADPATNSDDTIWGSGDLSSGSKFFYCFSRFGTGWNKLDIIHYDGGFNYGLITPTDSVSKGSWYHIVITSDGNIIKIYLNGIEQTLFSYQGSNNGDWFGDISGLDNLVIGDLINGTTAFDNWQGLIDEPAFWNRALSSDEVSKLYASGSGLQYPFSGIVKLKQATNKLIVGGTSTNKIIIN